MLKSLWSLAAVPVLVLVIVGTSHAQRLETPRRHDRPPGPPLSPEEAVAKMTVPEGFSVEIVSAEPDVVNPVAMCIDEKGRFWITESLEYPRKSPGPGRDRVKVLEDTDGDGKVDKTTVFADGLNIPSGIAVGYGGVWVANSPDILFMRDTDGDLKADKIETVVTGFGRTDTHELPNSLTWGPDGWLYGLNGVFNYCDVKYSETNPNYAPEHPGWKFTCAMFRIHPRTRKFEIFAEGTSNPWGIAINEDGEFFISACVIDHLWHIVETGYYIRQGGPYPPHTWPMGSIVEHKHQKAAYCGITWFDSDAYPEEYRGVLYMGNIHGGCINADIAERHGSTYKGKPHPGFPPKPGAWDNDEYGLIRKTGDPDNPKLADFLTANDAWFMPVVQKVGPDGCLYILDWYDRYHCYQDANADPEGIERVKGRLYRVRYKDTPHAQPFDLTTKSDDELIALLGDPNVYYRETAQRLLTERISAPDDENQLARRLMDFKPIDHSNASSEEQLRRFQIVTSGINLTTKTLLEGKGFPKLAPWALRTLRNRLTEEHFDLMAVGELGAPFWTLPLAEVKMNESEVEHYMRLSLNRAILARNLIKSSGHRSYQIDDAHGIAYLLAIVGHGNIDRTVKHVVWEGVKPTLMQHPEVLLQVLQERQPPTGTMINPYPLGELGELLPRMVAVLMDSPQSSGTEIGSVIGEVITSDEVSGELKQRCLLELISGVRGGRFPGGMLAAIRKSLEPALTPEEELIYANEVTLLKALWGDHDAVTQLQSRFASEKFSIAERIESLRTLIDIQDDLVLAMTDRVFSTESTNGLLVAAMVDNLGHFKEPGLGEILLSHFSKLDSDVKPKAIEVLTQRAAWSRALLKAIHAKQVDKDALNLNQIARVASFKDEELQKLVAKVYGQVRTGRRGDQQQTINRMRDFLHGTPGDAERGALAFKKVCAQCHKIYGEGAEVGPDITRNGRNNWLQLLTNVFDPSAVIGPGYQARILVTTDGRVLTGLAVEESDQRVVLKIQGGKTETIPRDQIEEYKVSEVSMMPEQLEKQLTPQEIADLFAFLALDKPPSDPEARILPGAPQH
ncbi:MAG: c-type cytochrome [Planctomycetaceae bacterium]|nr:c-type cytochrome [Planctomycetaceae bacterium]